MAISLCVGTSQRKYRQWNWGHSPSWPKVYVWKWRCDSLPLRAHFFPLSVKAPQDLASSTIDIHAAAISRQLKWILATQDAKSQIKFSKFFLNCHSSLTSISKVLQISHWWRWVCTQPQNQNNIQTSWDLPPSHRSWHSFCLWGFSSTWFSL